MGDPRLLLRTWRFVAVAWTVSSGLTACGPATPDSPAARSSMATPTSVSASAQSSGHENSAQAPTNSANKPAAVLDGSDSRDQPILGIPPSIVRDLASPDARTRFHALDHWTEKRTSASLDPVFEAMEDEDDAVRAKATAIVERQWALEQEEEKR
jgi:hypothetical protein